MSQHRHDHYAVLGVPPTATPAEIGHAYRALLRRHHPDTRSPGDAVSTAISDAELQRIITAYTILRDAETRTHYDRTRNVAARPRQPDPTPEGRPPIVAGPVRWSRTGRERTSWN